MSKLSLSNILSSYSSSTKINSNNTAIQAALENTLSRDGTSPNSMGAVLDMNSHQVINLPEPLANTNAATKNYVDSTVASVNGLGEFVSSANASGLVYTSPNGLAIQSKVVFVDLWAGVHSDGSADSTTGLINCITANGSTNVRYVFNSVGNYKIYSSNSQSTSLFDGIAGNFHLETNGCTFTIGRTFTGTDLVAPWLFRHGSYSIRVGKHTLKQTTIDTPLNAINRGTWWLNTLDGVDGIYLEGISMQGGKIGLSCQRSTSDATKRTKNIQIDSLVCDQVAYPLAFENNGDDVHIKYMKTTFCVRPFIAYNWHGLIKIDELVEQDSYTQAEILCNSVGSNLYNNDFTSGSIDINHIGLAPTGVTGYGEANRFAVEHRGTGGVFGLIKIKSDTTFNQSGALTQGFLQTLKTTTASTVDTVLRNHVINMELDIILRSCPATLVMGLFDEPTNGDWGGERVTLKVNKLYARGDTSSVIYLDYDAFQSGPYLSNWDYDGTFTTTGTESVNSIKIGFKDQVFSTGSIPRINANNNWTGTVQTITAASPRIFLNNTSGTASSLILASDSATVEVGSSGTTAPLVFLINSVEAARVIAEGILSKEFILTDGITAPSATSGQAKIFVDTSDGDLKIIFGDGTVKTIVVDT